MEFSLDSYRSIARIAGIAHRARDGVTAKEMFTMLWQRLNRETLQNHCDARAAFNAEFARAYRGQLDPPCDTPAPNVHAVELKAKSTPAPRKSVALDCAAFYAKQRRA